MKNEEPRRTRGPLNLLFRALQYLADKLDVSETRKM